MLKKPNSKIISLAPASKYDFFRFFFLLFFVCLAVLSPQTSLARNESEGANCTGDRSTSSDGKRVCFLNKIQLTTDVLVDGKSTNLIRVGPSDSVTFTVKVTLNNPPDIRASNAAIASKADEIYFSTGINLSIGGFGATLVPQDTTKYCSKVNSGDRAYDKCQNSANFGAINEESTLKEFKSGSEVFSKSFTITPADFKNFGITKVKNDSSGEKGLNLIYAYPDLVLVYPLGSNDWTTFFQGGKAVYVQLYSSQEALKNDTTSPPACTGNETVGTSTPITCVQGNGSVTSKGGYTGGGSGGIAALINEIFGIIIGFLQELVYGIFYWLIAPLIQAMLSIHVYTDTFVAVIYPGWEVIRNICNIFFIIALIVIALATLFRVESYQARGLLVQLILAALMINFSLVIAQAILALADTVQAQFLPANVTVIRSLAGDLMVGTYRDLYITKAFSDASFSGIIKPLFFLAMSIGSFAVFTAIAVFLLIRVVAIWLLLLISPLAYALGVLPSTAQYKKTWWDNFLKYAFFTPIMAFFLNMTAVISNQFKDNTILQTVSDPRLVQDLGNSDVAAFVFRVASNLLLLVFLIAALKVADMAGVYGASAITSTAQKGIFAPFAIVGGATKAGVGMAKDYGSRKKVEYTTKWFGKNLKDEHGEIGAKGRAKQALFAMFNPSIVKKSLEERKERKEHEVGHEASAVAEEITASLPWIDEPDLARRAETVLHLAKEKGEKETPYLSERQAIGVVKQIYAKMLKGKKDNTTKLQYLGALDQLMGEKGMNEILVSGVTGKKYEISRKGAIQWINDQVASGIIDEDEAGHLAAAMSKHAYENKEFWYAEIYNMDHHGHPKRIHSSIDKDTGEVIVEGESDYKSLTNDLENKFESFVQAKASETPEGTTPENLAKLRKKHRSDFEKEFWEKAEHANPDKYHKYENYKAFENSKLEAYTNFTKLGARDKIGFAHWSLVADIMTNGEYKMSDITGRHILDANEKNDYSQASHMNAKKNNALQRFIEDAGGVEKAYETYKDALEGVAIDREMQKRRDKGFAATPEIREQIKKSLDTDEEVEIGGIKANYHKQIRDDIKVRFQKYDESMVHFKPVSPGDKPPKS